MHDLKVSDLSMTYELKTESIEALSHVSFDLQAGELLTVLGPSGCGKTTLLNIIAGFLSPTGGEVVLGDSVVEGPSPERGMVFQQGALFEWMNVGENVGFGPKMSGKSKTEVSETVEHWLNVVGLNGFADKAVYELSGGMQQRISFARCLANNPGVVLMDEPLGALDALTREKMQKLILNLWDTTGKTMILITHSVEEALMLGQKLFVMAPRPGRIKERYELDFATSGLTQDSREIKTRQDFIAIREEILAMIWSMEEEIMGGNL